MSAQPINPELLDEFTPEFIAEANALREKIERKAGLLHSEPRTDSEREAPHRISSTHLDWESRPSTSGRVSSAQLRANRANAQLSCGPRSMEGKETVSFNAFRHGLTGRFAIMPYESEEDYQELLDGLREEHRPATRTEHLLVDRMAEHHWLSQRALYLQGFCFNEVGGCDNDAHLALYLRYQTTHERAFHKCLNDLLKLKAEKRKEQIGFVSQERKRKEEAHKVADQARRENRENRQQERHKWALLLDEAKLDHQNLLNSQLAGGKKSVEKAA
ncbi:MAG: hypothetical protein JO033_02130 [Acidobacteriaceae bacterium]|nr:hypothetical protein [Acidobacteriaceae bacterium]MBV9503356.1 hypothetical protein [Acidobacteriaceae bacterium]